MRVDHIFPFPPPHRSFGSRFIYVEEVIRVRYGFFPYSSHKYYTQFAIRARACARVYVRVLMCARECACVCV